MNKAAKTKNKPFFFSSRRRHTRWPRDWSSDVCSSDLAVLAMVARQALRMAVYEIAHELQVVAPFRGRDQELRLEQLVQAEQGLVAAQLVLHELVRRLGALRVERRLEDDVEQVERRKVRQVAAQEREPLLGAPDRAMALEQALRDEREISRVLLLDALPGLDGAG